MEQIPGPVRAFVDAHLTSAVHLEVLLLLRRRPDNLFDAPAVGRELRIDVDQGAQMLSRLARSGLARRRAGCYGYHPRSLYLSRAVDALVEVYPAYRPAIISLIFSRPLGAIHDHPGGGFGAPAPRPRPGNAVNRYEETPNLSKVLASGPLPSAAPVNVNVGIGVSAAPRSGSSAQPTSRS